MMSSLPRKVDKRSPATIHSNKPSADGPGLSHARVTRVAGAVMPGGHQIMPSFPSDIEPTCQEPFRNDEFMYLQVSRDSAVWLQSNPSCPYHTQPMSSLLFLFACNQQAYAPRAQRAGGVYFVSALKLHLPKFHGTTCTERRHAPLRRTYIQCDTIRRTVRLDSRRSFLTTKVPGATCPAGQLPIPTFQHLVIFDTFTWYFSSSIHISKIYKGNS